MAGSDFIKIYETKEEAFSVKSSIYDTLCNFRDIQLLPNNILPYIQRTSNPNGVEVEDWTCYLVNSCSGLKVDITAYFEVDTVFFDDNGANQIQWRITNVPFDYGLDFVYLEIDQLGQSYFSTPFLLTDLESEKTSRIDYGNILHEDIQSIQLKMFFRQDMQEVEQGAYNQISTSKTVTTTIQTSEYQKYIAEDFRPITIKLFNNIFNCIYVFCELERVNLFAPMELGELTGSTNSFMFKNVFLTFLGLIYDPLYVAPIPTPDYDTIYYNDNDYNTI
tara:strand:- start:8185 stop:9015 length:831 start_codon:yes stop_codon:yes gene_type:complete